MGFYDVSTQIFESKADNLDDLTKKRVLNEFKTVLNNPNDLNSGYAYKPPTRALNFLFQTYNKEIYRYPNDRGCKDCILTIFNFWKSTINRWQTVKKR